MKHFFVLLKARNIELLRDKATWIWNVVFPIILIVGIGFIFGKQDATLYKIGVVGSDNATLKTFKETRYLQFIDYPSISSALSKLQHNQVDLVLESGATTNYWVNDSAPQGYVAEKLLLGSKQQGTLHKQVVSGKPMRYLDWVLPGIMGINIMHCSLFGVGYAIVRYRKNGVLKRLKATPVNAFEFLSAQVASRLVLIMLTIVLQFMLMNWLFDFLMQGSYRLLLLIALLGAMALLSLSLLMASRTSSEELAAGLLNLITWPMILLSGVWFSLEGAPQWLQKAALALPLTHVLNAARAVMIDGVGVADITPQLITLSGMTLVFLLMAAWRFKWTED